MSLLPATREFLALVETETGYPVRVREDPSLPTLAVVRMARGNVPAHFVTYKPTRDESNRSLAQPNRERKAGKLW